MYKICFTIIFVVSFSTTFTQTINNIHFEYDDYGNRTHRYIVIDKIGQIADSLQNENEASKNVFNEQLGEVIINIFPNPTTGILKIQIQNLPDNSKNSMGVVSSSGRTVYSNSPIMSDATVDLTSYPNGVYFLNISIGGKVLSWTIIKQ